MHIFDKTYYCATILGESILRHLLTITARLAGGGVHFHSATTLLPASSKIDDLTRKTQSLRRKNNSNSRKSELGHYGLNMVYAGTNKWPFDLQKVCYFQKNLIIQTLPAPTAMDNQSSTILYNLTLCTLIPRIENVLSDVWMFNTCKRSVCMFFWTFGCTILFILFTTNTLKQYQ